MLELDRQGARGILSFSDEEHEGKERDESDESDKVGDSGGSGLCEASSLSFLESTPSSDRSSSSGFALPTGWEGNSSDSHM